MIIIPILIFLLLGFYVYTLAKFFQAKIHSQKQLYLARSRIILGLILFIFGINQLIINYPDYNTTIYVVSAIFILYGIFIFVQSIRNYYHILAKMNEEKNMNPGVNRSNSNI